MKLRGLQFQIGVRFLAFLGSCTILICAPSVEAQSPTPPAVGDLALVSSIARFPETVGSRPIDELRDIGEVVPVTCLKIRHGERKIDHTRCYSIPQVGFDPDISNLKFREKRFFPQPLSRSVDDINRISDAALDTAGVRDEATIEKFRKINLKDSAARMPRDQAAGLVDDPTVPPDTGFR